MVKGLAVLSVSATPSFTPDYKDIPSPEILPDMTIDEIEKIQNKKLNLNLGRLMSSNTLPNVSGALDVAAFNRRSSLGGGSGVNNTVFQNSGGNSYQTAYTTHLNPTTQLSPALAYLLDSSPLTSRFG